MLPPWIIDELTKRRGERDERGREAERPAVEQPVPPRPPPGERQEPEPQRIVVIELSRPRDLPGCRAPSLA